MEHIYSLNSKLDKKSLIGSLVYQKDNKIYSASIKKYIEHNQVHRIIEKSFEFCTIKNGDTPLRALFNYGRVYSEGNSNVKDYRLNELKQQPGDYYPRIFRPFIKEREVLNLGTGREIEKLAEKVYKYSDFTPANFALQVMAVNQLGTLMNGLLSILDTTYPATGNLKAYGQSMKNLLVLSCIEVEAQLKGVFKANESSSKKNYTTWDYVRLKDILQVDKYSVKFPYFPDLKVFTPFKKWQVNNPTTSLDWYDSYNAIKHNGELDFHRATLENAISAFSAVAILLKAQYGNVIPFWEEKIGAFMEIENNAIWKIEDMILPPFVKGEWNAKKIPL